MNAAIGTVVGLVIVGIGLTGLGVAITQMMTHADPNGTLISLGGLGAFLATVVALLILVR